MQQPRRLTLKEARSRLKCGEKFLRAEIRRRAILAVRVNARVILIDADSIEKYEQDRVA